MSGYSWPHHGSYDPDRLRRSWPTTITMLPVGARITGTPRVKIFEAGLSGNL
jgi:hypothetical protein